MYAFRWLSLRLFFSLLLLPFVAAIVLFVLHRFIFSGLYFQDIAVVVLLWLCLFVATHFVVVRSGVRRFQTLLDAGWEALKANHTKTIHKIFAEIDSLLNSGMIPRTKLGALRHSLFRRYFDLYRENINQQTFRDGLVQCLIHGIRVEEAYLALKTFLLQQPRLTISLVDLAETLQEFKPADQAVKDFMVQNYLAEKQRHYRAEYFYSQELARNGGQTEDILSLCQPFILKSNRADDFACWVLLRAYQRNQAEITQVGPTLYRAHQIAEYTDRDDALAEAMNTFIEQVPEEVIAGWEQAEIEYKQNQVSQRIQRVAFAIHQKFLLLLGETLRFKNELGIGLGVLAAVLILIYFLPFGEWFKSEPVPVQPQVQVPVETKKFALQVSATKSRNGATNELNKLKSEGLEAFMDEPTRKGGWYKIYVGRYATYQQAKARGDSLLSTKQIRDFFVVNYKK